MRSEWPPCIKKFGVKINPLINKAIKMIANPPSESSRGTNRYPNTMADLTPGGDLPIFPASPGPDSP
jgi:hypothetical protein